MLTKVMTGQGIHTARHRKPDREIDAHGEEGSACPVFNSDDQSHNESENSIARSLQWVEASSVPCDAGISHSIEKEPTTTQAERRQQKERERKGKQRQQKRATTWKTLEEALARVDNAGASLDVLDAANVSARRLLEHSGAPQMRWRWHRVQVVTCLSC
jgi:hypothetical protein